MSKTAMLYVQDAITAARDIIQFIEGRTADHYEADPILRAAVERKFEIVGEALRNVRQLDPALAATIPELRQAVAFRNILVHGYATVVNATVWSTAKENLPDLLARLEQIRAQDASNVPNLSSHPRPTL